MSRRFEQPLPRYPVFERVVQRDRSIYIIILIVVIVIFAITALVVYLAYRDANAVLVTRCEPGLCVVNLTTGEKRCPATLTDQLTYDQVFEDCTSGNYCQSDRAPCSILANGTLNCRGVCGTGNTLCRCQKAPV